MRHTFECLTPGATLLRNPPTGSWRAVVSSAQDVPGTFLQHTPHAHSTHMAPYVVMGTHAHPPSHHSAPTLVSLHLSLPKHAMRPLINFTVRKIIEINKIDTTHPLEPRTTEQPKTKSQHFQTQKSTHIMHRLHCTKKTHFANT